MDKENVGVCPFSNSIQCLGICEMTGNPLGCKEFYEPLPQLESNEEASAASTSSEQTGRFGFASEEKLAQLAEGLTPECTKKSTKWAMSNFMQWKKERNSR